MNNRFLQRLAPDCGTLSHREWRNGTPLQCWPTHPNLQWPVRFMSTVGLSWGRPLGFLFGEHPPLPHPGITCLEQGLSAFFSELSSCSNFTFVSSLSSLWNKSLFCFVCLFLFCFYVDSFFEKIFVLCLWLFCLPMCMCIKWMQCPWQPGEGAGFPGDGVTDGWELSLGGPARAVSTLNPWAISPALYCVFWVGSQRSTFSFAGTSGMFNSLCERHAHIIVTVAPEQIKEPSFNWEYRKERSLWHWSDQLHLLCMHVCIYHRVHDNMWVSMYMLCVWQPVAMHVHDSVCLCQHVYVCIHDTLFEHTCLCSERKCLADRCVQVWLAGCLCVVWRCIMTMCICQHVQCEWQHVNLYKWQCMCGSVGIFIWQCTHASIYACAHVCVCVYMHARVRSLSSVDVHL
jgi:hypothetical protein